MLDELYTGTRALQIQSWAREKSLGLDIKQLSINHAREGGEFFRETPPRGAPSLKGSAMRFSRVTLSRLYVGPARHVYFLTSGKDLNADKDSIFSKRMYTIRRYDILDPSTIEVPGQHYFREFETVSKATASIKRLVQDEWRTWTDNVNEVMTGYYMMELKKEEDRREAASEKVREYQIEAGTYNPYSQIDRFSVPFDFI